MEIDQNRWIRAYLAELERLSGQTHGRVLNTIFFGGGTPSLMNPETVAAVIEAARSHWPFANDMEITLESNPTSVEAGRFAGYRDAGVNRVSMGIQALNDPDLKRLGRLHTAAEARRAFDIARNSFDRVSFDLIYARQGQSLRDWKAELATALSMAVDHLSLYQLTIEAGTAFGDRHAQGKLRLLPDDDLAAEMFHATQDLCSQHGMSAYEVSNHAVPGAESRHNLIYWRSGDYLGTGPGAHGRLTLGGMRQATESHRAPAAWLDAVEAGSGEESREALSKPDIAVEYLMMGMRLSEGIDLERFSELSGVSLPSHRLSYLEELDMIEKTGQQVRTTDQGRAVLNAVLREMLADM